MNLVSIVFKKPIEYFDKFLKYLKTDRNTFFTYILTLISIYICIDRFVEILIMCFSGMSVAYWGPIKYTIALACPVFAFLFSGSSKFADHDVIKLSFFYLYCISLFTIGISMLVQWINQFAWLGLISVPNYVYIINTFPDLIKPAFTAASAYIPLITFYPFFKWLYTVVNDTKDLRDSIFDYGGIDLSNKTDGTGPYTCEIILCRDKETGKFIKTPESRRFESTLVVGVSGAGKTSMIFEPMIARDIERKNFFFEASKELGFASLKSGLATLTTPYSNEYLNEHFSLNMLTVLPGKEKIYKAFTEKLTYNYANNQSVYKNLGITYMAPDYESISRIIEVAENFNIKYNLIDPENPNSIGLNPFVHPDPITTAVSVSEIIRSIANSTKLLTSEAFMQNTTAQAIENTCIMLKEWYPKYHENLLPTLEDLLKLLNNFNLIEVMCEDLKRDEILREKYSMQFDYFKNNFYHDSPGKENMQKQIQSATTQLEDLLRHPGIKQILCNRTNNLDFDKALINGEITLMCTRRGNIGATNNKLFGLFAILLMQRSVLSRPGVEKSRIPHFLYIDEFPSFVCKATQDLFTLYRKYRVGLIISAQNLSQFGSKNGENYRQTILANCTTKIVFGNNTPEDNEWWQLELGEKREWAFTNDYDTAKGEYNQSYKSISWKFKPNYMAGKVQALKFKAIMYKTKDLKGKSIVGSAKVDFLEAKYKEKHPTKKFNFDKFTVSVRTDEKEKNDPIKTLTSDSHYSFNSQDAIAPYKKNIKKNTETE